MHGQAHRDRGFLNLVGMVYAINSGGYIKIGVAGSLKKRVKTLQTGSPHLLEVVFSITTEEASLDYEIERELHTRLKEYRMEGEWFAVPFVDLQAAFMDICDRYNVKKILHCIPDKLTKGKEAVDVVKAFYENEIVRQRLEWFSEGVKKGAVAIRRIQASTTIPLHLIVSEANSLTPKDLDDAV